MKIKLTSLLLIMAFLLSVVSTYSFASTSDENNINYTTSHLHYQNSYGDSDDDIGGNLALNNAVSSTFEVKEEANGNHYGYYTFNDSTKNVFMEYSPDQAYNIGSNMLGYMILEFDFNDFGKAITTSKFLEVNSGKGSFAPAGGRIPASNILNVANDSGGNYFYFCSDKTNKIYFDANAWTHVRCEFSVLSTTAEQYHLKCYIGDKYFEGLFDMGTPQLIYQIRIGSTNSTNQSFGIDNMTVYTTPDNGYKPIGKLLTMKIGAENASLDGRQIELTNVPMLINGQVYCPLDILEDIAKSECPDQYAVVLDGERYIHIDDVKAALGISAKSFAMGLIMVGDDSNFISDSTSYDEIANVMKNFIFNIPSADKLKDDVTKKTNGYDHPYLLADSDRFAELRNIYTLGNSGQLTDSEEKTLYSYMKEYLDSAKAKYKEYCGVDVGASYNGIASAKIPVNKNYNNFSNNGYDNGGRINVPAAHLIQFAFAYQITGNLNYARATYDYMLYLGKWNHWGPDHFLNCADAAAPFSIAYDWLYDAFVELNGNGEKSKCDSEIYDKSKLATILFTHVILPGYVQSNGLTCPWPGSANSRYSTKTSNWNAVCTSGVVAAALMLLEEDVSTAGMTLETQIKQNSTTFISQTTPVNQLGKSSIHEGLNTYSDYAAKLTSMNLGTLAKYGLNQYVPDGSYIESPSYWAYGTNTLFRLIATLLSATGDDYGFMDAWGIDTTCYFAIHSESSDYNTWNFNDGSVTVQDSSYFFFVGGYYGDDNLVRVRKKHLNNGKKYSLYDILFYDTTIVGEPDLSTEYHMVGIDAFSVRSSWDKGAIYAGIIGGPNTVSHGQLDAGAFIYHNNGKIWFTDLGADNYNMAQGYFSNFNLYRVGGEGHNMLLITSEQNTLPYGQSKNANPKIVETKTGTNGGYAILDMSSAYGSHVKSGQRGMLFTNSRSTVVIQDEYVFDGAKTAYWFGHYQLTSGYVDNVIISADGRTAFMISGNDITRVSIASDNPNLKFEIMDAYTYVLDTTFRTDRNKTDLANTEYSRDTLRKLAIKCENVTELNLAVVIEEVTSYELGCSYEYINMSDWSIQASNNPIIDEKFKADFESTSLMLGAYNLNSDSGSYTVKRFDTDNNSYLGILTGTAAVPKGGAFKLYQRNNEPIKLSEYRYLTFDADIFTDSSFIDNSKLGIKIRMYDGTTKFVPLLALHDSRISVNGSSVQLGSSFAHITVIINTETGCAHIFIDDTLVATADGVTDENCESVLNLELNLVATYEPSQILLDNVLFRTFSKEYDNAVLSSVLANNSSLGVWSDRVEYQQIRVPLATANGKQLYTASDIEVAIESGHTVTLLGDVHGTVSVEAAATVNTNGYSLRYVSDTYICTENDGKLTFSLGNVTVKWHIGDQVITETYTSSRIATFEGSSSEIGKIFCSKTENESGTTFKFYTTGWARYDGGIALSSADMVVSSENCEFWLVNNVPVTCDFVRLDANGTVTPCNGESLLRTMLTASSTSYEIILCNDMELKNTTALYLPKSGKTLYLNGYTLSHKQNDVHAFLYSNGSTGNFNILGPGTVESVGSRTLFTTSSSTSDKTSEFGIVAKNVHFKTNTQLGDLRVGQHKFISCTIEQTNASKILLALWNKNSSFLGGGVPENLLTVTFEKSDISVAGGFVSYSSGTFSRVYVTDSRLKVGRFLIDSTSTILHFSVSGDSDVIANALLKEYSEKYTSVVFGIGTKTNLEIPSVYLTSGGKLTYNFDLTLPYRVSDNYTTVTWQDLNGNVIASETVAVGTTTSNTHPDVLNYLKNEGSGYTYSSVTVTDKSGVILTPIPKSSSSVMISMTVDKDLIMYLYIEKSLMDSGVKSVKVDGTKIMSNAYEIMNVSGVDYYRYSILTFVPSKASKVIDISIEYSDGRCESFKASAVGYLEELLSVSLDDAEKTLIIKLLKYIQSAERYFNSASMFEQDKIASLIEQYKQYDLLFGKLRTDNTVTATLRNAVRSVCFNLSASARIRFYLNESFTGQITVSFAGKTACYNIKNGLCEGYDYFEIVMPAPSINESITVNDGTNTITYGLNTYATAMNGIDDELDDLLICLSEYSSAAEAYVNR